MSNSKLALVVIRGTGLVLTLWGAVDLFGLGWATFGLGLAMFLGDDQFWLDAVGVGREG